MEKINQAYLIWCIKKYFENTGYWWKTRCGKVTYLEGTIPKIEWEQDYQASSKLLFMARVGASNANVFRGLTGNENEQGWCVQEW